MSSGSAPRTAAIFFSDLVAFSQFTERVGDRVASDVVNRVLELQRRMIEEDGAGRVLEMRGDSVFAVFDSSSVAMTRALRIQHELAALRDGEAREFGAGAFDVPPPAVRIGLHLGEVRVDGEQPQVISRHVNRAHRVMELAGADQVLASRAVVDAGRDYIEDVPHPHLAIEPRGVVELKGVGATEVFELADRRVRAPAIGASPSQHAAPASSARSSDGFTSELPAWLQPRAVPAWSLDRRRLMIQLGVLVAWAAVAGWLGGRGWAVASLVGTIAMSAALVPLHLRVRVSSATISLQGHLLLLWGVYTTAVMFSIAARVGRVVDDALGVCLGFWAISAAGSQLLLAAIQWRWRPRPGKAGPWCPGCGYSLIGLTEDRCPECGREFTFEELGITEADLRAES